MAVDKVNGVEYKGGKAFQYFSESKIALMNEIKKHPALIRDIEEANIKRLENTENWAELLGVVAAYLGIVIDDTFTPEQLKEVEEVLRQQLVNRRVIYVQ